MSWKKCGGGEYILSGKVRGKQRYECLSCHCHFIEGDGRKRHSEQQHLQAVSLCTSGLSMDYVGKLFGVSAMSMMRWIKHYVPQLCPKPTPQEGEQVLIMELDKMCHYLKKIL